MLKPNIYLFPQLEDAVTALEDHVTVQIAHVLGRSRVFVSNEGRKVPWIVVLIGGDNNVLPGGSNNPENFIFINVARSQTPHRTGQEIGKGSQSLNHAEKIGIVIMRIVQPVVGRGKIIFRKLGDGLG